MSDSKQQRRIGSYIARFRSGIFHLLYSSTRFRVHSFHYLQHFHYSSCRCRQTRSCHVRTYKAYNYYQKKCVPWESVHATPSTQSERHADTHWCRVIYQCFSGSHNTQDIRRPNHRKPRFQLFPISSLDVFTARRRLHVTVPRQYIHT